MSYSISSYFSDFPFQAPFQAASTSQKPPQTLSSDLLHFDSPEALPPLEKHFPTALYTPYLSAGSAPFKPHRSSASRLSHGTLLPAPWSPSLSTHTASSTPAYSATHLSLHGFPPPLPPHAFSSHSCLQRTYFTERLSSHCRSFDLITIHTLLIDFLRSSPLNYKEHIIGLDSISKGEWNERDLLRSIFNFVCKIRDSVKTEMAHDTHDYSPIQKATELLRQFSVRRRRGDLHFMDLALQLEWLTQKLKTQSHLSAVSSLRTLTELIGLEISQCTESPYIPLFIDLKQILDSVLEEVSAPLPSDLLPSDLLPSDLLPSDPLLLGLHQEAETLFPPSYEGESSFLPTDSLNLTEATPILALEPGQPLVFENNYTTRSPACSRLFTTYLVATATPNLALEELRSGSTLLPPRTTLPGSSYF